MKYKYIFRKRKRKHKKFYIKTKQIFILEKNLNLIQRKIKKIKLLQELYIKKAYIIRKYIK